MQCQQQMEFSQVTIKEEHESNDEQMTVLCDLSSIVPQQVKSEQSDVVTVKKEYNSECSRSNNEERKVKNEHDPLSIVTETQTESMAETSSNTSSIPILQFIDSSECDVSETDEDISQHTDVDLCSYSCDFDNKRSNKRLQLQKINVIHKDEQSTEFGIGLEGQNVQLLKNNRRTKISQHICSICNKLFTHRGHLNIHMRTHTGDRPFSCEICNKSFKLQENLKRHRRIHTGKRPFSCQICNKSCTQNGALKIHMRTHSGERPFSCEICEKSFSVFASLNNHMRTHTGQRPFSCDICNKSFSVRAYLTTHMRTHTGERPFSCEVCNKSFTNRSSLNRHMRIHTGP